jgi:hypothetical protein
VLASRSKSLRPSAITSTGPTARTVAVRR